MPPGWEQATATCRAVGEHCYIFVSNEEWNVTMTQADVDTVFDYLENTTMNGDDFGAIQMDIDLFGPIPDELDNDEKIIVYYSALGSFNGSTFDGYFSSYNQVTEAEAAIMNPPGHSNECEMIYMTCSPLDPTDPTRISVLSHELQHLIHWGQDINEDIWVNEGMAELAMLHFGLPDPITSFNSNANYSLNMWDQQWKDYVKVLLFFSYLDEKISSENFIQDVVSEPLNGIAGIRNQLIEHGYQAPFETFFINWTIANYLDEPEIYNGIYNYESLELPNFSYNTFINSYPGGEEETVQPWATRYIRLHHDVALTANIEVNQPVAVALLNQGDGVETIVENFIIEESGIIEIPSYNSPYHAHTLVFSNANDSSLDYSIEIAEVVMIDENQLDPPTSLYISNYPNPFNLSGKQRHSNTTINFMVKHELVPTEIALYNLRGQKVRTLVDRPLAAGEHQINWNGKNEAGKLVSAGLYLAKIRNGQEIMTHKMILLK